MVVIGQSGCIRENVVDIRAKVVVFAKGGCIRGKMVVIGQKWLYSGKVVIFWQKLL